MTITIDTIKQCIPKNVQEAVRNYQTEKLGAARMGCEEVTLDKVAQFIGEKIAARRHRWRSIKEGLTSLAHLENK